VSDFRELVDLASERLGGKALEANDEFFAPKENLLKAARPVFREGEYTDRGKWMDGWETRRRREPGHDWCVIQLWLPGIVRGVVVDTAHFTGNFPEACSLDAREDAGGPWREILLRSPLAGDSENPFAIEDRGPATHVRLNIFPDGGVARLRVYGTVLPDWERLARGGADVDLALIENGGLVVAASDAFFGSRHNLILPGRGKDMSDGWETKRRRGPGHDWAVVRLGTAGTVRRVEVDTLHFKGNAPGSCSIEAASAAAGPWRELLPETKLSPDSLHRFEKEVRDAGEATHARLNIFPDGGISRLRLFGRIAGARS